MYSEQLTDQFKILTNNPIKNPHYMFKHIDYIFTIHQEPTRNRFATHLSINITVPEGANAIGAIVGALKGRTRLVHSLLDKVVADATGGMFVEDGIH